MLKLLGAQLRAVLRVASAWLQHGDKFVQDLKWTSSLQVPCTKTKPLCLVAAEDKEEIGVCV